MQSILPAYMGVEEGTPGVGEQATQSVESRVLSIIQSGQRQDSEPVDPYQISDALMSYQDQVSAKMRGKIVVQGELIPNVIATRIPTQEDETFLETIRRVRDAFDIIAFPYFPPNYQSVLSGEVYGNPLFGTRPKKTHQGGFTLTPTEKRILTQIAVVAGVPDDPQQLTYSYFSIPHIVIGRKVRQR